MTDTKIYVIHVYTSSSDAEWFPWLKEQLESSNVKVCIPDMPDSDDPYLEPWLKHLRKVAVDIDENLLISLYFSAFNFFVNVINYFR